MLILILRKHQRVYIRHISDHAARLRLLISQKKKNLTYHENPKQNQKASGQSVNVLACDKNHHNFRK